MDFPMEIPVELSPLGIDDSRPAPGTVVVYGNNGKRVECFNLNTKTNCSFLFSECRNTVIPEGVTFASCTNATSMF